MTIKIKSQQWLAEYNKLTTSQDSVKQLLVSSRYQIEVLTKELQESKIELSRLKEENLFLLSTINDNRIGE